MKKLYSLFTLSILFISSVSAQTFTNGVFVLNEGGAGSNNAGLTYFPNGGTVQNNVYATVNPTNVLGDTAQSMGFNGNFAYIVLNISNTVKVVNRQTMQYVATISTGLNNPRYITFKNGKGYVTNWGNPTSTTDDYVAVLNLESNTVESTIAAAEGVERILELNNKLYVAHQGGYGFGNTISVINPTLNSVEQVINVGDVPNSMVEKDGILYVLCGGKPSWSGSETFGKLVKINVASNVVVGEVLFPNQHPSNLKIAGSNMIYGIDDEVFSTALTSTTMPTVPLLTLPAQNVYGIYGMEVIDNKIYIADALNYGSQGKVYIYSLDGAILDNVTVGPLPNSFYKVTDEFLGTGDLVAFTTKVYPNPATDVFYIQADKAVVVKLFDMSGRLVRTQDYSQNGVNVSDLKAGMYVVEIASDNAKNVQKLIIR